MTQFQMTPIRVCLCASPSPTISKSMESWSYPKARWFMAKLPKRRRSGSFSELEAEDSVFPSRKRSWPMAHGLRCALWHPYLPRAALTSVRLKQVQEEPRISRHLPELHTSLTSMANNRLQFRSNRRLSAPWLDRTLHKLRIPLVIASEVMAPGRHNFSCCFRF